MIWRWRSGHGRRYASRASWPEIRIRRPLSAVWRLSPIFSTVDAPAFFCESLYGIMHLRHYLIILPGEES